MSKIDHDEQDEKPLDPVLERVRRKMIRLQLVSAGVMVVALMAVLIAIVYKGHRANEPRAGQPSPRMCPTKARPWSRRRSPKASRSTRPSFRRSHSL